MDRLELAILKILLVNNGVPPGVRILRKSFRSMAKDLGVDQSTVRERIRGFQRSGVLKGWMLGIDPGNVGLQVGQVWLGVHESVKAGVIDYLQSAANVERVCNYFGPTLSFVFLFQGSADPERRLASLLEPLGSRAVVLSQGTVRAPNRSLKDLDEAIIESLRSNPWKAYSQVAKEVRASAKTVARRVVKMSEQGAIYMLPVIDLKALQGVIPAELVVGQTSMESKGSVISRIVQHIGGDLVFSDIKGSQGYFALFVGNLSQLEQLGEWCKKQEGVASVHVSALQDVILNTRYHRSRGSLGN